MNALTSFTISFCTVCIVVAALTVLCPDGTFNKSIKYILALVFLLCLLSVIPVFKNIELNYKQNSVLAQSTDISARAAEIHFAETLKNAGIPFSKIKVYTDNLSDGSILITRVVIYSDSSVEQIQNVLCFDQYEYKFEVIG